MQYEGKWENMTGRKISFIIVNHQYREDIARLLDSMERSCTHYDYEVVIVDNASSDGSREYFEQYSKKVIYRYLETNIGYGAANNMGVKLSTGSMIVFINPDTFIPMKGFDRFIVDGIQDSIGILSPAIRYPDGKRQPNCGTYSTLKTFILQSLKVGYFVRKYNMEEQLKRMVDRVPVLKYSFIGTYLDNFSEQTNQKECDWVSGACMIMTKRVFDEVDGFDENFFLYCEDEDLCRRISNNGYRIIIDPSFTLEHNEGFIKSRRSRSLTFAARHRYQSSMYYLTKHIGRPSAFLLRVFYIFQHLFNAMRYLVIDPQASKTYFCFLLELTSLSNRNRK